MTRIIPRLFIKGAIFGALLCPATLYALGLGDIHLNSALSQPFDAEIELLNPTVEELNSLKVGLASSESFTRMGLERPAFLSSLSFKVTPIGNGRAVVHVTSTRSISEPVVSLVLEATWGQGRAMRDYTVFLDPPVFVPSQPEPAAEAPRATVPPPVEAPRNEGVIERTPTPTTEAPPPVVVPPPVTTTPVPSTAETAPAEPLPVPQSEPETSRPAATTPSFSGDSYEVQRNESLWKIASRLRPGTPQSINQTMIALYRANPSAFAGNINRLRAGAVLRVPQADEFDAVDVKEAAGEVTRQFNEWRPESAVAATEDPGHLRLVTPTESAESGAAASKAAEKAAAEKANAEKLAAEKANADAEAKAQQQRASDAEAKRLLDLKNAELARMQAEREQQAAKEAAAKEAAAKEAADAAAKAAAAQQTTQPPVEAQPQVEEQPAEPVAETQPEPVVPPPAAEPEPSLTDKLADLPWTMILGGIGIIALIGGWVVYSRRRQHADSPMQFPMPSAGEPTMTPADFEASMTGGSSSRNRAATSYDFDAPDEIPESLPEAEGTKPLHMGAPPEYSPTKPTKSLDETMSSETAVHIDQQDAVAEADFHMAYGLYDQAADLVKIAIGREPKRRDLKLKLLEIYFVWGNKELFLESARELHATRSQAGAGEWDKILIMGKQIAPDDSLFKGSSVASAGDMLDVNLEGGENRVDFDLFSTPEAGEGDQAGALDFEIGNTGARAKPSSHLDFLLDDSGSSAQLADDDTREMDANARTQETPTIESPVLGDLEESLREPTVEMNFGDQSTDQTAELSIDDLGLDVGSLESTGSLERTTALSGARREHLGDELGDDELTRIAPAMSFPPKAKAAALEPTMEVPQMTLETSQRVNKSKDKGDDDGDGDVGISTIYLEQMDAGSGDVMDTLGPRADETAHMLSPADLDLDLAQLGDTDASDTDTIRRKAARMPQGNEATAEMPALRANGRADTAATVEQPRPNMNRGDVMVATSELPEMEPVTMSEVGTKLDLARAYMDMGDPDGARSILEEVLGEGNSGQRAEAQRLLDSIR
jgi:pilus assembly protein FimV